MNELFQPLALPRGPSMKNRFMLAPMTNTQSHEDGCLSDEEYRWLTMRAKGGFGLTMTCAAHVQPNGKGFPGQLGIFSDDHLPGLRKLASGICREQSLAVVQLHHAGMRSPADLIGTQPVCPSDDNETQSRSLSHSEVHEVIEDFVAAAIRADQAGFDGVEVHGAHGYLLTQFLSAETNRRTDEFGGTFGNRMAVLLKIIEGIRSGCRKDFILGVRISPERYGLQLEEMIQLSQKLLTDSRLDFLDVSLWDFRKEPENPAFQGRTLMSYFTNLERGLVSLGAAGGIRTPDDARQALQLGLDWVMLGKAAILHHDFPNQCLNNPNFTPVQTPVSRNYLKSQGLSEDFIDYMARWPDFVKSTQGN